VLRTPRRLPLISLGVHCFRRRYVTLGCIVALRQDYRGSDFAESYGESEFVTDPKNARANKPNMTNQHAAQLVSELVDWRRPRLGYMTTKLP
jgi:hypothetical protein